MVLTYASILAALVIFQSGMSIFSMARGESMGMIEMETMETQMTSYNIDETATT